MMKINKTDINLRATLLSGQLFRVNEENDKSFTIVLSDRVVNLKEEDNYIIIDSNNKENLESVIKEYLDLERKYDEINEYLLNKDLKLKEVINYSKGYKILRQPKFEMVISYILSQNNTVKNISSSIEKLSTLFGKKIVFKEKEYYLFPSIEELSNIDEEELKKCSVGFRSKYIINAIKDINNEKDYLNDLDNLDSDKAIEKLMKIKGIGLKVSSCILLFGYARFDVFPIDTWVKKYFNSINEEEIKRTAKEKYGEYSGLVIQYMFHYMRNKNVL